MKTYSPYVLLFLLFFSNLSLVRSQESTPENPAPSAVEPPYGHLFKTTYLDLSAIYNDLVADDINDLLPPPVVGTISAQDDQQLRENVFDDATKKQLREAKDAVDSIFSYAHTLGNEFSAKNLPKTKALFDKVDDDARLAIYIAKRFYGRRRPMNSSGYSYPSGHSTRAFLWDTLLAEVFPDDRSELETQAKVKAWNRVILGRHYPADVYAGRAFGTYLAQQLLNNPDFQQAWQAAQEEMKACVEVSKDSLQSVHSLASRH